MTKPGHILGIVRTMNIRRISLVAAGCLFFTGMIAALSGCSSTEPWMLSYKVPFSGFSKISLGAPKVEGQRVVVPVEMAEAEPNASTSLYYIKTRVSNSEIDMTAVYTLGGVGTNQLVLKGVSPGDYTVSYRDPDGKRHKLSQITVPKP